MRGPPGQKTQVPWGQLNGAEKTVTMMIPEALLLGWMPKQLAPAGSLLFRQRE